MEQLDNWKLYVTIVTILATTLIPSITTMLVKFIKTSKDITRLQEEIVLLRENLSNTLDNLRVCENMLNECFFNESYCDVLKGEYLAKGKEYYNRKINQLSLDNVWKTRNKNIDKIIDKLSFNEKEEQKKENKTINKKP